MKKTALFTEYWRELFPTQQQTDYFDEYYLFSTANWSRAIPKKQKGKRFLWDMV